MTDAIIRVVKFDGQRHQAAVEALFTAGLSSQPRALLNTQTYAHLPVGMHALYVYVCNTGMNGMYVYTYFSV